MAEAILYAGIVPYGSIRQRPQWFAEGLSQRAPLLYLEPNASPLRGHWARPRGETLRAGFERFEPGTGLPLSGLWRPLNRINYARVRGRVQRQLQGLGWDPSHLFVSFPKQLDLLKGWPSAKVVYDVMDDYPAFFGRRESAVLTGMHHELLERADVVLASSRYLAEGLQPHLSAGEVHVVENAVASHFGRERSATPEDPDWPRPCFGYVGALASWLDYEAIDRLARAYPNGCVVLIGPEHTQLPELPSNVLRLGERRHEELPGLIRAMDLTLVPFQVSEATHAVNPVKVYEYLACGKQVLATPCRELMRFETGVHIAEGRDWPAAAAACLANASEPEELAESVQSETWEARVQRLWGLLKG